MTVVSSLMFVTEMMGVVGVDMVVVFVSNDEIVITETNCFTWIVKRDVIVGDSTYGEGEWYLILLLLSPSVVSVISKRFLLLPCCRPIIVFLYHPRILLFNHCHQLLQDLEVGVLLREEIDDCAALIFARARNGGW